MRKYMYSCIWGFILVILYFFLARISICDFNKNINLYMQAYLNNIQKYLYLITLSIFPFMFFNNMPFLENMTLIRIMQCKMIFVMKYMFRISLRISVCVYAIVLLGGMFWDKNNILQWDFVIYFLKLFIFTFYCVVLQESVYVITKNIPLSSFVVLINNFMIIVVWYMISFGWYNNDLSDRLLNNIFSVYQIIFIFVGMMIINYKLEIKKDFI